jgi:ribose transport system ATP-binding protein
MRLAGPLLNLRRERESAAAALAAVSLDRSPDTLVGELSPAEKALVAIARALSRESSLLFVDEATSTLPPTDALRVLTSLRDIVARSGTVIMVTHKLNEVLDTTERIVVMVDGDIARDEGRRDLDRDSLVRILVAEAENRIDDEEVVERKVGEEALVLDGVCSGGVGPVELTVRRGEIVGLTGLPGSGLHDVAYLAAGALRPTAGEIRLAAGAKLSFVPPHRETQGGFPELTVRDNLTIAALKKWRTAAGLISVAAEGKAADEMVERLGVHPPSADAIFDSLSGGNKQKVIFGRALFRDPDICVLCEPTRGVDAKTRREIYGLIRRLRDGGAAILVVSSDAEDLFSLADEVGAVVDGQVANVRLTKEMAPNDLEELV